MPGNPSYQRIIDFLMPDWDSKEIDVEFRNMGILGMQRTGKTTLAITIANDLKRKYPDMVTIYGYWLHQIIPRAREEGLLKDVGHILIILDDATAFHAVDRQILEKLQLEMKFYWRIAHELKKASIKQYTSKVTMLYLYHSYMLVNKFMRNAQLIAVKSLLPRFQQYEREDVTLKWFDAALAKGLTRMRFSNKIEEVHSSLNKAIVVWMTGSTEIIKYHAIKQPPKNYYDYTFLETEDEKDKDENQRLYIKKLEKENKALRKALLKILDENQWMLKVNRRKYLLAKMNNHWISLGPIANTIYKSKT